MSNDSKRIYILVLGAMLWFFAMQYLGPKLGLFPKPNQQPPAAAAQADVPPVDAAVPAPKAAAAPPAPKIAAAPPDELLLAGPSGDPAYRLSAQLTQDGAGVEWIELARHESERERKKVDRKPLKIVKVEPGQTPSFAIESVTVRDPKLEGDGLAYPLANIRWEVVRDAKGQIVHPILDPKTGEELGREASFRISMGDPAVTITKTFRLRKNTDGLELSLTLESPKAERKVVYKLDGPRTIPIEGEWYTSLFRDVFVGLAKGDETQVMTRAAGDVVGRTGEPEAFGQALPVRYAGIENQYFAVLFEPDPSPTSDSDRIDDLTIPTIVALNVKEKPKSDVSVEMSSKEIDLKPGKPVQQSFKIFAGPKTVEALTPYNATDLATYRKTAWYFQIPGAAYLAQKVISPLLDKIYGLTASVANVFGGKRGSYGIAIILLTITVRMILFPLSRKQAVSAKKMQDLQPKMAEIKEKYKDDKERVTKETWALYKKNNVNPMGGCLLGIIQLPIFVGLWQALNNSVALRHAPFLWIDNLAAPDMLLKFPIDVPLLGPYFNLLPLAVVSLMLVQMHLFTPPATTPDQEMSQKLMKFMMVFMSFMFYKVPSGLGIYFITSSSWAICERLLLPKMIKSKPIAADDDNDDTRGPGRPKPGQGGGGNGDGGGNGSGPKPGGFRDRLRQIVEEAQKDRTHRNSEDKDRDWGRGGKPRPKPPGRKR